MKLILITDSLLVIGHDETAIRLKNYDRLQLPTDCSSGKYTREQRQLVGVLGEIALRVACNDPPKGPWSTTELDGGSDYTLPSGRTVQIMTACTSRCSYCYYPDFKPLKADVIVQAKFIPNPRAIALLGAILREDFEKLAKVRPIGTQEYWSIYVDEMEQL